MMTERESHPEQDQQQGARHGQTGKTGRRVCERIQSPQERRQGDHKSASGQCQDPRRRERVALDLTDRS